MFLFGLSVWSGTQGKVSHEKITRSEGSSLTDKVQAVNL